MAIQLQRLEGETDAAYIKRLQGALAAAPEQGKLYAKITGKGAVAVYGNSVKFPQVMYRDQWKRLAQFMPDLLKFIDTNAAYLAKKGEDYTLPVRSTKTEAIFAKSAWGEDSDA